MRFGVKTGTPKLALHNPSFHDCDLEGFGGLFGSINQWINQVVVSNMFYFHPWGNDPIWLWLINFFFFFSNGLVNHQLDQLLKPPHCPTKSCKSASGHASLRPTKVAIGTEAVAWSCEWWGFDGWFYYVFFTPRKIWWNLKIIHLQRKIIWTKPSLLCSMLIFRGVSWEFVRDPPPSMPCKTPGNSRPSFWD